MRALAFVRYAGTLSIMLSAYAAPLLGQANAGQMVLRVHAGPAVPLSPDVFRSDWHIGPSAAIGVGYAISQRTELGVAVEYGRFGTPEPMVIQGGALGGSSTSLWAAWVDVGLALGTSPVQPRAHLGAGVVGFGAARTGLGVRAGLGVETPLSARLHMSLDATFVHGFTHDDTEQHLLGSSLSYTPVRVGLAWR
jgi:hypothetical protein